jgi:SAM-dependent methyltransferase
MTDTGTFHFSVETFDKLYRGEPLVEGGPAASGVPWDIHAAQPAVMELEALGAISGDVLDIGCGLGENSIYLATYGHSVTGLDGSATAIDLARGRAAAAGVAVSFDVADATKLAGYDGRFNAVIDSGLYHCLGSDEDRMAYAAGLHRATQPGARWFLYCFSAASVNGIIAPAGAVPESNIRDILSTSGWHIDYFGPTTFLGNTRAFDTEFDNLPEHIREQYSAEVLEQMRELASRVATIALLINEDRVHLPISVVHATRVD